MYPEHIGKSLLKEMTTAIWFKLIFINWDRFALIKNKLFFFQLLYAFREVFGF